MKRSLLTTAVSTLIGSLLCGGVYAAELKQLPAQNLQAAPAAAPSKPMMMKTADDDADKQKKGEKAPAPAAKSPTLKPMALPQQGSPAKPAPAPTTPGAPKSGPTLQAPPGALQKKPGIPDRPELRPEIGRGCPDPAITELRPGWPQRHDDGTYSFKLLATIKNVGGAHYRSRNTQQTLILKEGNRVLTTEKWPDRTFHPDYAPGEAQSVVHHIANWGPNSEFLADFTAHLSYDPDITLDGNPENDDCRSTNNSARLSVAELKRILSALP